jgi:hypothetical protein
MSHSTYSGCRRGRNHYYSPEKLEGENSIAHLIRHWSLKFGRRKETIMVCSGKDVQMTCLPECGRNRQSFDHPPPCLGETLEGVEGGHR